MSVSRRRAIAAATVLGLCAGSVAAIQVPAFASTQSYVNAGTFTYEVPGAATSVNFLVCGAHGGSVSSDDGPLGFGGLGTALVGTLDVTAGETLTIVVGGSGESVTATAKGLGGYNGGAEGGAGSGDFGAFGGAGGGGGTDIRQGGADPEDRVAVAAGGGGATAGNTGGSGGLTGEDGRPETQGGKGATQVAAGNGGAGASAGSSGELLSGGNGAEAPVAEGADGGGGGGGGLYGGGGGAAEETSDSSGSGGGGSSAGPDGSELLGGYDCGNGAEGYAMLSTDPLPLPPEFSADPSALDFGEQQVGETSAPQAFTITNKGAGDLNFPPDAVSTSQPEFEVADDDCSEQTLTPNQTCTVQAAFAPTASGLLEGTLIFASNVDGGQTTVSLTGTGIGGPAPTIDSLGPDSGTTLGGTVVTIDGTGFANTASVSFGDLPAVDVSVLSGSRIQATTPIHPAGEVAVTVTVDGKQAGSTFRYENPAPVQEAGTWFSDLVLNGSPEILNSSLGQPEVVCAVVSECGSVNVSGRSSPPAGSSAGEIDFEGLIGPIFNYTIQPVGNLKAAGSLRFEDVTDSDVVRMVTENSYGSFTIDIGKQKPAEEARGARSLGEDVAASAAGGSGFTAVRYTLSNPNYSGLLGKLMLDDLNSGRLVNQVNGLLAKISKAAVANSTPLAGVSLPGQLPRKQRLKIRPKFPAGATQTGTLTVTFGNKVLCQRDIVRKTKVTCPIRVPRGKPRLGRLSAFFTGTASYGQGFESRTVSQYVKNIWIGPVTVQRAKLTAPRVRAVNGTCSPVLRAGGYSVNGKPVKLVLGIQRKGSSRTVWTRLPDSVVPGKVGKWQTVRSIASPPARATVKLRAKAGRTTTPVKIVNAKSVKSRGC